MKNIPFLIFNHYNEDKSNLNPLNRPFTFEHPCGKG